MIRWIRSRSRQAAGFRGLTNNIASAPHNRAGLFANLLDQAASVFLPLQDESSAGLREPYSDTPGVVPRRSRHK